jgi:glycerophosphoryl diester phosphodiesterase
MLAAAAVLTSLAVAPASSAPGARVPYAGDFDGDGRADLYWAGAAGQSELLAFGGAGAVLAVEEVPLGGTYRPLVGDYDGDGRDDVLHYGRGAAPDLLWYGGTDRGMTQRATQVRGDYRPAVGDFDGDGRDDVLWFGPGKAADLVWYGGARRTFGFVAATADGDATPVVGDFDGDGQDDVRWHGSGAVWYGAADRTFVTARAETPSSGYTPLVGDFDGEGTDDVLWYPDAKGAAFVELGSRLRSTRRVETGLRPGGDAAVGDFNGDGADDVLVTGPSPTVAYGTMAGLVGGTGLTPPKSARPIAADFDGDRFADVYWTGADELWRGRPGVGFTTGEAVTRPNRVPALDPAVWAASDKPYGYVAHAMGGIDGHPYTNSLEAFKRSYALGFRVFEVDFVTLRDGTIMALHDGTERHVGLRKPYYEATAAELRGRRYLGKYTVLSGADVVALMRSYRDIYVVLDTKWDREEIAVRLLRAAGDPQVARRMLPHIAGQQDLDVIRRSYPLQHYVVALYRTQIYGRFDDAEVLSFVRKSKAPAVMMWLNPRDRTQSLAWNARNQRRYEPNFAASLQQSGAVTYVHSTGDAARMREYAQRGIGVYSDGPFGPDLPTVRVPL